MAFKFQLLGVGLDTTRSLDRAIMAPSLNTANNTIRRVGKYLQLQPVCQPGEILRPLVNQIHDQCVLSSEVQTQRAANTDQSGVFVNASMSSAVYKLFSSTLCMHAQLTSCR